MSSHEVSEEYSEVSTVFIYRKDHFLNTAFLRFLDMLEPEGTDEE